jgi:hypothetical protein
MEPLAQVAPVMESYLQANTSISGPAELTLVNSMLCAARMEAKTTTPALLLLFFHATAYVTGQVRPLPV